jgi:hypothetical protein
MPRCRPRSPVPFFVVFLALGLCPGAVDGAEPDPEPVAEVEAYREHLDRILGRREFRALPREPGEQGWADAEAWDRPAELVGRVFEGFFRAVERLLKWLFERDPAAGVDAAPSILAAISQVLAWGLAGCAIGLAAVILVRALGRGRGAQVAPESTGTSPTGAAEALARPAPSWLRDAADAAARGAWSAALRARYLALCAELHARGAIRCARDRTNGDYVADLSGTRALGPFARLTGAFDAAWYGDKPVDESGYRAAEALAGEVERAALASGTERAALASATARVAPPSTPKKVAA